MTRVVLIHWNKDRAPEQEIILRGGGYAVEALRIDRSLMLALREQPPEAFVIDFSRSPSEGQAFAIWLRQQKSTRRVPIVFAGGSAEKIERARQVLPDVPACAWDEILPVLQAAIASPLENPVVPGTFDSYSGTPLPKKLGLKPGSFIALLGAPAGFESELQPLPGNARLVYRIEDSAGAAIILLFARSMAELAEVFPAAGQALGAGGRLWIVWPKKTAATASDISERTVRAFGLAAGFVDYKISAIDATWSGLCFARRQPGKQAERG